MSDQFISAVTNEAMSRICYSGGWDLKPYKFLVSQTDIFDGISSQPAWDKKDIWDNGDDEVKEQLKEEASKYLQKVITEDMQQDYSAGNAWFNARFSSITKTNETTLAHHLNIPGDIAIDTNSKTIKTIYFIYQDNSGQDFLYAVARCNATLIFEKGITQSFFFNFTVTNAISQDMTNFILNYSCAHEIEDHNTTFGSNIHSDLVARDGSRALNGILSYTGIDADDFTQGEQLVSKAYVDKYIQDYLIPIINQQICPPGTMSEWPGTADTVPQGWAIRMGQWLNINDNPGLYRVIGTRYGTRNSGGQAQFKLMDDRGLFTRYSEYDGSRYNYNTLNGVGYGMTQASGGSFIFPHAGYSVAPGHGTETFRVGWLVGVSGKAENKEYLESIGAVLNDRVINLSNSYPQNVNYLPIIRLG